VDTLGDPVKDTNRVVRQEPEPKGDMPKASEDSKLKATIVVNRSSATVPALVGEPLAFAIDRINQAGLRTGTLGGKYTGVVSEGDRIVSTAPVGGTVVALGSPVNLVIYKYSETPPRGCTTVRDCFIAIDPKIKAEIQQNQPKVRTMPR
jgi:beta-lactam-binding protein with PASTA domain